MQNATRPENSLDVLYTLAEHALYEHVQHVGILFGGGSQHDVLINTLQKVRISFGASELLEIQSSSQKRSRPESQLQCFQRGHADL